ncbi:MAG TPA: PQQ-dependent sugar dehydrogenase [Solirubrobacterales bacterium]|nr:PQQ-dependent sugar dehydrogenase [Solirubrobacterales bacterium]
MSARIAASLLVGALLGLSLPACGSARQQSTPGQVPPRSGGGGVALKQIGSFDSPVDVTGAPGFPSLLFVVEQPGRVEVLRRGHGLPQPFLDISGAISSGGERGLLSIAFPPDYKRSKRFYAYFTNPSGNIQIDEFKRRSPTRAAGGTGRKVIEIPHPVNSNHNGGQLQFLGNLLYFGTGDGGSGGDPPNNAQNRESLLGKLLRIDPRPSGGRPYSVPATNPFVGRPGRDEIYSYGLRNPFRFSFDTVSARQPRLAIGDVGQNRFEELDYTTVAAARGANFGWDAFEGFSPYRDENSGTPDPGGTTKPIFAYPHSREGSCSIIGGYVVADPHLPSLYKHYVYADLCEGQLRSLVPHLRRAGHDHKLGLSVSSPTSFGEDDQHRLYVASLEGPVYRLVPR